MERHASEYRYDKAWDLIIHLSNTILFVFGRSRSAELNFNATVSATA